jgi:hypothetical protein
MPITRGHGVSNTMYVCITYKFQMLGQKCRRTEIVAAANALYVLIDLVGL